MREHAMALEKDKQPEKPLPSGTDLPIPWHLQLPDALERDFQAYFLEHSRRIIAGSFFIVALLFVAGTGVEFLVEPENVKLTWRPRLLSIFAAGGVWIAAQSRERHQYLQPAVAVFAVALSITNNYLGATVEHALSYSYYLINLFAILLMGSLFRITMRWTLPVSGLVMLLVIVSLLGFSHLPGPEILVVFFFVFSGGVLCLIGQYFHERLQRQHFLAERVLALHRSELHSANQVLENQATEDALTQTVNRRGMETRLSNLIREYRSQAAGEGGLFLLLFDIDFFKHYNDSYGHLAGDACLRKVSATTKQLIQNNRDFVARYGGEEFVVVLTGIQQNDALVFAERMRSRIEKMGIEHKSSRASSVVTISVGMAGMTPEVSRCDQFIARADEALYHAKSQGRNCVVAIHENDELRTL
jgi:diguanylate cyclase (GGDEF)-like protein